MNIQNSQRIIKLKEDTFFFPTDEGTYFRNNYGYFTIKGRSNYPVISEICGFLNGEYTLDDIMEDLDKSQQNVVLKIINILEKNGFIKYTENSVQMNEEFQNEINFLDYYTNQGRDRFKKFANYNIGLLGSDELAVMIQNSLRSLGAKNIKILNPKTLTPKNEIIICCNLEMRLLEEITSIIPSTSTLLIINKFSSKGIISQFIKNKTDWLNFLDLFLAVNNEPEVSFSFTANSVLASVASFEMFKYITNCLDSDLIDSSYILDCNKLQGEFYKLKNKITNDLENNFTKIFEAHEKKYGSPIIEIGRGDKTQLPLSQWEVIVSATDKNKFSKKKIVEFGDNHEEARIDTYYKTLEYLISHNLTFHQSSLSVRSGKTFNFDSINYTKEGNITFSINENKDTARRRGTLRCILQYILDNCEPIDNEIHLDIEEYLDDKEIEYYYKICCLLDRKIKLFYYRLNDHLIYIKCFDEEFIGVSLAFDVTTAIINAIRTYIMQYQKKSKNLLVSNFNFKYMGEWNQNAIYDFLKQHNIDILQFEIRDNILLSKIPIIGAIIVEEGETSETEKNFTNL